MKFTKYFHTVFMSFRTVWNNNSKGTWEGPEEVVFFRFLRGWETKGDNLNQVSVHLPDEVGSSRSDPDVSTHSDVSSVSGSHFNPFLGLLRLWYFYPGQSLKKRKNVPLSSCLPRSLLHYEFHTESQTVYPLSRPSF